MSHVFSLNQSRIFTIVLLFIAHLGYSQRQANNWYFGEQAGFTFQQGIAEPLNNGASVSYGSPAVVSDPITGELLFYSNGEKIWNRKHQIMPNGNGLNGSSLSTNNAYVVPVPQSKGLYYLFTLTRANYITKTGATISYSIVDTSLQSGLGDITIDKKNILLEDEVTEKIAAIEKKSEDGYWLILHGFNSNNFIVYEITNQGISLHHVNAVGEIHQLDYNGSGSIVEAQGHMKASPDGKFIAVTLRSASGEMKPFELFDFDRATGDISNPKYLGSFAFQFGVSFSPDSRKLYLHGYKTYDNTYDYLHQFDLDVSDILSSRIGILINNPFLNIVDFGAGFANFDLQLGPDGKLYTAGAPSSAIDQEFRNSLFVISSPNLKGYASNIVVERFDFSSGKVNIGLPNFIQSIFKNLSPNDNPNLPCGEYSFNVYPNPTDRYLNISKESLCSPFFKISIYDMVGRVVSELSATNNSTIDLLQLAGGTYLVRINFGDKVLTVKVIKT